MPRGDAATVQVTLPKWPGFLHGAGLHRREKMGAVVHPSCKTPERESQQARTSKIAGRRIYTSLASRPRGDGSCSYCILAAEPGAGKPTGPDFKNCTDFCTAQNYPCSPPQQTRGMGVVVHPLSRRARSREASRPDLQNFARSKVTLAPRSSKREGWEL